LLDGKRSGNARMTSNWNALGKNSKLRRAEERVGGEKRSGKGILGAPQCARSRVRNYETVESLHEKAMSRLPG